MGPNEILDKGFVATDEVPWFHVVKHTGIDECALQDDAGGDWLGIAQEEANEEDVSDGRVIRVRMEGISRAVCGDDVSFRDRVTGDAAGFVVPAGAGDHVVGIALTAGGTGDWINVQLTPGVAIAAAQGG
jgi:hypothetical protein